jgi:hypothetical protein
MALCKDPSLTYLNKYGYNVVRLPRQGLDPMDLLGKNKALQRLGRLKTVWQTSRPEPQPGAPQAVADMEGSRSDDLDLSVGLKVLSGILSALGADAPVDFAYKRARKIQFGFTNVVSEGVDPLEVGAYLGSGDLDRGNDVAMHYFTDEDAQAFVVTEVLRSDTIHLTAKSETGTEVAVDVPAIANAVGAKVAVRAGGAQEATLTYSGRARLTFGFKAFAVAYVSGHWRLRGAGAEGDLAFALAAGADDDLGEPVLLSRGLVALSG